MSAVSKKTDRRSVVTRWLYKLISIQSVGGINSNARATCFSPHSPSSSCETCSLLGNVILIWLTNYTREIARFNSGDRRHFAKVKLNLLEPSESQDRVLIRVSRPYRYFSVRLFFFLFSFFFFFLDLFSDLANHTWALLLTLFAFRRYFNRYKCFLRNRRSSSIVKPFSFVCFFFFLYFTNFSLFLLFY